MRLHQVSASQIVPIPLDEAWQFFANPSNLRWLTPDWLNLRPSSEVPDRMHPGLIVTYEVVPFPGLRTTWVTEITHVVEGSLFVDEQRAGPYRFWHHQH